MHVVLQAYHEMADFLDKQGTMLTSKHIIRLTVYRVPNTIPLEVTSCLLLQGTQLCSLGGCHGQLSHVYSPLYSLQHALLVSKPYASVYRHTYF